MKAVFVLVVAIVGLCLHAQYVDPTVIVNVSTPPRYSLPEGIGVAIETVSLKGKQLTVQNVMNELEEMKDVHDVALPYRYTRATTTGKDSRGFLKGKDKQKKKEVEGLVSRMITMKTGETKGVINDGEPKPKDFEKREAFVAAYVNYKRSKASEEELLKFKGRIGGMENNFRREARNQALKVWNRK